jgi:hypothetical protein
MTEQKLKVIKEFKGMLSTANPRDNIHIRNLTNLAQKYHNYARYIVEILVSHITKVSFSS